MPPTRPPRDSRDPLKVTPLEMERALRRGEARALGEGEVKSTALHVPATDGFPLAASFYAPVLGEGTARGTVVIASATGVRRHFYDDFARALAGRGFRVVTFDYRGIGGSRPKALRGFRARARDWGQRDLEGVLAFTAARFAGEPHLLVAHSIGGHLMGLAPSAAALDRALLVATPSGHWRLYGLPWRWIFGAMVTFGLPWLSRAIGYFPARSFGVGEDLPLGVAIEWASWCRDPEYLLGAAQGLPREGFDRLAIPLRAIVVEGDPLAPPPTVASLLALYPRSRGETIHVGPRGDGGRALGHFGWFRKQGGASFWDAAAAWLGGG